MAIPVPFDPNNAVTVTGTGATVETQNSTLPNQLPISNTSPTGVTGTVPSQTPATTIRNLSQSCQEREIIKTAPDVIVYLEGTPYLTNYFIDDPKTKASSTLVNFNDHVTAFNASYDTDIMVPNATIGLQVPNFLRYLYKMPGGNNLLETMMQVQVYAKGYYLASNGDTVYRRVFKGITSHISYNDNGKTLEISIQCQGSMHLLEKMQINVHPSAMAAATLGSMLTWQQSIFGDNNCFTILAKAFTTGFQSDGFQASSVRSTDGGYLTPSDMFYSAVTRGYMAKWQAILMNMIKDVHIYGPDKDTLGQLDQLQEDENKGKMDKDKKYASVTSHPVKTFTETITDNSPYYKKIQQFLPFRTPASLQLTESVIVNRLDLIREVVKKMDFEAYQDIDGKIIIKPPLYNLDVTNLGTRSKQTSSSPQNFDSLVQSSISTALSGGSTPTTTTSSNSVSASSINPPSTSNSMTNPLTQIYPQNNPFVVYLSEMLTEQETEDQSAIRRTRTTITGNIMPWQGNNYPAPAKPVAEYIDVTKLAKFGLREEPMQQVPWLTMGDKYTLFAHAAAETARTNRGYRTYSFTIPMRPELKLGFPVFIPHKDMYAYIKSVAINYQVGGSATMSIVCDTVRPRVLVKTAQTSTTGNVSNSPATKFSAYTTAPNLIYMWTNNPVAATVFDPAQPQSYNQYIQQTAGGNQNTNTNMTSELNVSQSLPAVTKNIDGTKFGPTDQQIKVYSYLSTTLATTVGNKASTPTSTYVIVNDTGYFNGRAKDPNYPGRPADGDYVKDICGNPNSVIPYTDDKGYELISPFPWGRWKDLNTTISEITEQGWINIPQTNGLNGQDLQDETTFQSTEAFLFAGLGTPTATSDPSTMLSTAMATQQSTNTTPTSVSPASASAPNSPNTGGNSTNTIQPDVTVIVLDYSQPGSNSNLLNAAQPENALAASLVSAKNAGLAEQQLVSVLVSGTVAPIPAVQEQLLIAQNSAANAQQSFATLTLPGGSANAGGLTTTKVTASTSTIAQTLGPAQTTTSNLPVDITP